MTTHSLIVGGSSAKRVLNCPGSVDLAAKAPPKPASSAANEGTLLHEIIAQMLTYDHPPEVFLGKTYGDAVLTEDLIDTKLLPAMALFDSIDPDHLMSYQIETRVDFGSFLPGVFGSTDVVGRIDDTAFVIDWKFGQQPIDAEENEQLMFYAAAAMRTEATKWAFGGVKNIELVIIQPPFVSRWTTTRDRIVRFETELRAAVKLAQAKDAPLRSGAWCKFCPASVTCPAVTGELDRTIKTRLREVNPVELGALLEKAELLEDWIKEARQLATKMLESNISVPGYKMVQKRAVRVWADEGQAEDWLRISASASADQIYETKMRSPASIEKELKIKVPSELVSQVSSGLTLAHESDPRPAAITISASLKSSLARLGRV
jgi:hypothetical protein